jgi:hypothetical protein
MISLMAPRIWLFACLGYVFAVPVEISSGNNASVTKRDTLAVSLSAHFVSHNILTDTHIIKALQYPYSLQLHLSVIPVRQYSWFIFQGPQGIAVDPCQEYDENNLFQQVFVGRTFSNTDDALNHPPFPDSKVSRHFFELVCSFVEC